MALGLATDQWKRSLYDYVKSSRDLAASMARHGFLPQCALPIDPNEELLGGAHRLACALALGADQVSVNRLPRMVWAPAWHREWFIEHGVSSVDLARIDDDWEMMNS